MILFGWVWKIHPRQTDFSLLVVLGFPPSLCGSVSSAEQDIFNTLLVVI